MALSRRALLLAGASFVGGITFAAFRARPKGFIEIGRAALKRVYGDAAVLAAGEEFLVDADVFLRRETKLDASRTLYFMDVAYALHPSVDANDWIAAFMVHRFAMSSTVVVAMETGAPVEYTGFSDPFGMPCSNQLSAFNAAV